MSERSFSEYSARSVVKNPLLSTAVTGLCLEDLTNNAVLLPVRSQDLGASQDLIQTGGSQSTPLRHTPTNDHSSRPNIAASATLDNTNSINANPITHIGHHNDKTSGRISPKTQSKTSANTDDDFDVNEYFARLQGTRYVSAPINSLLKEDQNANLDSTEENLEEVNLDDSRASEGTQQSLTADIAQNFSQLPQVLPQVASAVFSSFSNYLTSKSRESTPDSVPKVTEFSAFPEGFQSKKPEFPTYREVEFHNPESQEYSDKPPSATRKLSDAKPIGAPPCPAPPPGSTSNTFRITTKRKAYAQIPGLSTGHRILGENNQHGVQPSSQTYAPPCSLQTDIQIISSQPPAIPPHTVNSDILEKSQELGVAEAVATVVKSNRQELNSGTVNSQNNNTTSINDQFLCLNSTNERSVPLQHSSVTDNKSAAVETDVFQSRTGVVNQPNIPVFDNSNYQMVDVPQCPTFNVQQPTVPPPPIFPLPSVRRNSQNSGVNKSILPPSVARRIGTTHPVLKSSYQTPVMESNFFIPKSLLEPNLDQTTAAENVQKTVQENTSTNSVNSRQGNDEPISKIFHPPTLLSHENASLQENVSLHEILPVCTSQSTFLINPDHNVSVSEPPKCLIQETLQVDWKPLPENVPASPKSNVHNKDAETSAPQMYFNPTVLSSQENTFQQKNLNAFSTTTQTQEEKPTTLLEPPKLPTGSQNFRMAKKRPQYYAGPIDNFTSTIDKVAPIVPVPNTTIFQGTIFTPETKPESKEIQNQHQTEHFQPFNLEETPLISSNDSIYCSTDRHEFKESPFHSSKLQESSSQKLGYSTAFDLSRPTTQNFEPSKEESKGFGIIGSLKSKLSAIDINKIQDSVTTFFDPNYNNIRKDTLNTSDASHMSSHQESTHDLNFDIFVPCNDQRHFQQEAYENFPNINMYNQDMYGPFCTKNNTTSDPNFFTQQSCHDSQTISSAPYYQQESEQASTQNNTGDVVVDNGNYYCKSNVIPQLGSAQSNNSLLTQVSKQTYDLNKPTERPKEPLQYYVDAVISENNPNILETESQAISQCYGYNQIEQNWYNPLHPVNIENAHKENSDMNFFSVDKYEKKVPESHIKSIFDKTYFSSSKTAQNNVDRKPSIEEKEYVDMTQNFPHIPPFESSDDERIQTSSVNLPTSSTFFARDHFQGGSSYDTRNESASINDNVLHVGHSCTLIGTTVASDTVLNPIAEVHSENIQTFSKETVDRFDTTDLKDHSHAAGESVHSALSTPNKENNISRKASVSDLNICETCREFNVQPEEKEAEDLTTQLIENITAPIQLLNPVEVPLPETAPSTDRGFFEDDQYAEISHITEETIETLQVQSATEFFDKEDIEDFERISNVSHQATEGSVHNYGWRSDFDEPYDTGSTLVKESYIFGGETKTDNFYSGNALFFDNVSTFTNASDEIKAVLRNAKEEEGSVFLSRQMSIPTAPPAEDLEDNTSDVAGGIDVNSIEQDANRDLSDFDPFVNEPSGTDDDKIEYREREKPTDGLPHVDSFTDRVEKYKQFEENCDLHLEVDGNTQTIENVSTVPSSAVTMASYFDTGNYAADTHYKNSIVASPTFSTVSITNVPVSLASNAHASRIVDTDEFKATNNQIHHLPNTQNITEATSTKDRFGMESVEKHIRKISAELSEITKFPQSETAKTTQCSSILTEDILGSGSTAAESISTPTNVESEFEKSLSVKNTEKNSEINLKALPTKKQMNVEERAISLESAETTISTDLVNPVLTSSAEIEFSFTGNAGCTSDPKSNTRSVENEEVPSSIGIPLFSQSVFPDSQFVTFAPDSTIESSSYIEKPLDTIDIMLPKATKVHNQKTSLLTGDTVASELSAGDLWSSSVKTSEGKELLENKEQVSSMSDGSVMFASVHASSTLESKERKPTLLPTVPDKEIIFDNRKNTTSQIVSSSGSQVSGEEIQNITMDKKCLPFSTEAFALSETSTASSVILPDPLIFFEETTSKQQEIPVNQDENFNRLASYFSSPPKTEHSKSFFELSQGQNHFRQTDKVNKDMPRNESGGTLVNPGNTKSFFELSQSQNHYLDHGLPPDRYVANIELMRDLASGDNLGRNLGSDSVVRTLNYFTVRYDNVLLNDLNLLSEIKTNKQIQNFRNNQKSKRSIEIDVSSTRTAQKTADINIANDNSINKSEINSKNNFIRNLKDCRDFYAYSQNDNTFNFQTTKNDIAFSDNDNKNYEFDTIFSIITDCEHCCYEDYDFHNSRIDNSGAIGYSDYNVKETMNSNSKKSNMKDSANQLGSKDTNDRRPANVSFGGAYTDEDNEAVTLTNDNRSNSEFSPLVHHWYYRIDVEGKSIWKSFSNTDSAALEDAFNSPDLDESTLVATDGGRFDVNVMGRTRRAVYWDEEPNGVRRCSWFYKGTTDAKYVPYTEAVAEKLELEYRHGVTTGEWHRRLSLPDNEAVVMHGPAVIVHFLQPAPGDAWPAAAPATVRPRVVRRGHSRSDADGGEPARIDHLILMCHGVGSTCDIRFRPIVEVVDDFRSTSLQLIQSHYKNSYESGAVGRVEVLPISWHDTLHSGEEGVDRRLAEITLDSIPRLRSFTNDTVLDVLFYTSPVYSQIIIDTVCSELNRIYALFKRRNPNFKGTVSLGGHSLGSVILYDLLCHQRPEGDDERAYDGPMNVPPGVAMKRYLGIADAGKSTLKYPTLNFSPDALYALGSPIAIFECIRGVESLGEDFRLPTCEKFFNIFHPYDPIAYRIEPLINPRYKHVPPYLIPHHKGRKRMHLELKETMARVGADLRQKVIDSIKTTWTHLWKPQPPGPELEKVVDEEMAKEGLTGAKNGDRTPVNTDPTSPTEPVGRLNGGRRVDRVLQEAPLEMINEYLFAMGSHVGYWESEDTMLLILREVYDALGVGPDGRVPPPTLTVHRDRRTSASDDSHYLTEEERPSTSAGTS